MSQGSGQVENPSRGALQTSPDDGEVGSYRKVKVNSYHIEASISIPEVERTGLFLCD